MIKVKQIYGHYDTTDFLIKAKFLSTLKTLIDINYINIIITN